MPRLIRVFVSSTFRDMQAEREELVKRIFPQVRKLCEARGVTWGEVDLRWGVTEEQRAEGNVLPICLAEIRNCRPYFLGLLGERYGWVPEAITPELVEQQPWLGEHRERSVTELEILHGVLNDPAMADHAFFCFRDPSYLNRLPQGADPADFCPESDGAKAKLDDLKRRIRDQRLSAPGQLPRPEGARRVGVAGPDRAGRSPVFRRAQPTGLTRRRGGRTRGVRRKPNVALHPAAGVFRPAGRARRWGWPAAGGGRRIERRQVGAAGQLGEALPAGSPRRAGSDPLHRGHAAQR